MGKNKWGHAFLFGAIAGGLATLFMPKDKQQKSRKFLEDKTKELSQLIVDTYDSEQVQKVFGTPSKDVSKKVMAAKKDLVTRLSKLKGGIQDIDKKKYKKVVDAMITDLKKKKELPSDHLKKLEKYLTADYEVLKKSKKEKST